MKTIEFESVYFIII